MKTVLATLNSKYIHPSLALRLLYTVNKENFDISFREYTIKENIEHIASDLLNSGCNILGLGVYIWNVIQTEKLVSLLKERNPGMIIILGGPEVSYEPEYFLQNWLVDYIISGEGEFVLGNLLYALETSDNTKIDGVSSKEYISSKVIQADVQELVKYPSPYMLKTDEPERKNKIIYFETSRGCPYQCQYCLSSLEKGVRYFPEKYVFENLSYLIQNGAKQIKFLDRTFNLDKDRTRNIFDFLIRNYRKGLVFQFEIYADLLDDEIISYLNKYLPENYFRFEIGIQSTYEPTNTAVQRKQDFPLLAANIKKLIEGGKVGLHLDLIAGLPYETFERFKTSFNDVFALGAREVQLGFLKMLRGTKLRKEADSYGYVYKGKAPYEIVFNSTLTAEELSRIHEAEHALEKYWNSDRFRHTMEELFLTHYKGKYFDFFDELGIYYKENNFPHHSYQLEDLFRYLESFLLSKNIDLFPFLRTDYYNNFSIRPNGFWKQTISKKEKKQVLYQLIQDKEFLASYNLTQDTVRKHTAIDKISDNEYLLFVFKGENMLEIKYKRYPDPDTF